MAALQERYPQLEFLMRLSQEAPKVFFSKEIGMLPSLDGVEAVIVYGVGDGAYFDLLKPWLEADSKREIVFIEEDINTLIHLEKTSRFDEIFEEQRVKLAYRMPGSSEEELAFAVIGLLESSKIEVIGASEDFREQLLRLNFFIDSMRKETLYYHKLAANLIPNLKRIPGSFFANKMKGAFRGVPAVICGAGPSLEGALKTLKELEHKALIFGGGSSIAALTHGGVLPHFAAAIDPNAQEWDCLKRNSAFDIPLFFGPRVLPKIFHAVHGDLGYVQTFSGGPLERMVEEKLGLLGSELEMGEGIPGMSVTTLNINLAIHFGCDPIILCGVDLAYTDDKLYASGVISESKIEENTLFKTNPSCKRVKTLVKWLMESEWIASRAKTASARFINATEGGLGFEGIEMAPLSTIAGAFIQRDLRGQIRAEIENSRINVKGSDIDAILSSLSCSITVVSDLLDAIVVQLQKEKRIDHPLVILYTSDLKEELAYQKLFNGIEDQLERVTGDSDIKKYKLMHHISEEYKKLFNLG